MINQGSIVRPTAGRNQDRFFVVVSVDENTALISDGRKRKLENPKRKKLKHLQETGHSLELPAVTTNKQLRKAITSLGLFKASL